MRTYVRILPVALVWALSARAEITFYGDIAPIVFEHCSSCHRPGEAAPFSLLTYDDVAKRGRQIVEATRRRYMPPWKAEPASHPYRGERRLSDAQIDAIRHWHELGMPEGDPEAAPPPPQFPEGWRLGEPDLVLRLPEAFRVPADGPDVYRNFVYRLNLGEDKWIRAIELRPSARAAVHHVLYFNDPMRLSRLQDGADGRPGFGGLNITLFGQQLGGWAVGQQPYFLPDGLALALPRGADFVVQYHFSPTGKEETEEGVIGLYFAEKAPERRLFTIQVPVYFGIFLRLAIPPGDANYTKTDAWELPVDVEAISVWAHAHYLGRSFRLDAELPDGEQQTLLSIPDWDFAWQDVYQFEQAVPLPKGTKLRATLKWDNSAENPRNPSNPPRLVRWGEQSADEMGSLILEVIPRRQSDYRTLEASYNQYVLRSALGGQ
jgi:hypothetical protein